MVPLLVASLLTRALALTPVDDHGKESSHAVFVDAMGSLRTESAAVGKVFSKLLLRHEVPSIDFTQLAEENLSIIPQSIREQLGVVGNITENITNISILNVSAAKNASIADVMRIKLDGDGDSLTLLSSAVFTLTLCAGALIVFKVLSIGFPEIYSQRRLERETEDLGASDSDGSQGAGGTPTLMHQFSQVARLDEDSVMKVAGLDAWMHLTFQKMCWKLIASLGLVAILVCPLHWAGSSSSDVLTRLSLAVTEERYHVLWTHVFMVWYVVLVTNRHLVEAQAAFLPQRYHWMQLMRRPQATTIIVEGIPEIYRSDVSLKAYFASLFSEAEVLQCYIVRRTKLLLSKLDRLEQAEQELENASMRNDTERMHRARERVQHARAEVSLEQVRVGRAAEAFDPDVCTDVGFVTFQSRRTARLASREQLATDPTTFAMQAAAAPESIIYESLMVSRGEAREKGGWLCVACLFLAFAPLVVIISSALNLNSLQQIIPAVGDLRQQFPILNRLAEGVLATFALNLLMGLLPYTFLIISRTFFRPVSHGHAQLHVQNFYFSFMAVFVLLVTSLSKGLVSTLIFVAQQPTAIAPLLAETLPLSSHFYMNYLVLGSFSCVSELLRPGVFAKYLRYRAQLEREPARALAEQQSVYLGQRVGKSALMLVITLVFCSLNPIIIVPAAAYFLTEHLAHGYLCYFAEPKQSDLGGAFWVQSLKQIHLGLLIYVLLMVGVCAPRGIEFVISLVPNLAFIYWSWRRLDRDFLWQDCPLDTLLQTDQWKSIVEEPGQGVYKQPECCELDTVMTESSPEISAQH
eukprot:TRINITY_DN9904_c0_g2_i3.p1 TRINITY_DN9904_c0_g2~~TRINITY_DN9904_c0_g2_i3.p1  ORF type:complete len:806 (+),score=126.94 TRINITY_DN9904_c0_g2_i3:118-2535(+)